MTFICSYKNFKRSATWEYVILDKLNLHFRTKIVHLWLQKKLPTIHSRGENCFCNSGFGYLILPKHDPYLLEESPGSGVTAPCANYLGLPPPMCVLSRAQTSLGLVNRPLFVLSWVLGHHLFRYLSCSFRAFGLFMFVCRMFSLSDTGSLFFLHSSII